MVQILFEDDSLIVLEKPAGVVTTSSETHKEETVEDILRKEFKITAQRGGIVHRLDKDTSGLLVVGKSDEIVLKLQLQFKQRTVKKEYLALVHGWMEQGGRIDMPIGRNPVVREKFTVFPKEAVYEGREEDAEEDLTFKIRSAVTEYKPLKRLVINEKRLSEIFSDFSKIQFRRLYSVHYPNYTLVSCFPLTGRTHQIRVHLKYIGFPIVADEKYGGRKIVRLDHRWCKRQFLHAQKLEFDHPISGERMSFESRLPEDLKQALGNLIGVK